MGARGGGAGAAAARVPAVLLLALLALLALLTLCAGAALGPVAVGAAARDASRGKAVAKPGPGHAALSRILGSEESGTAELLVVATVDGAVHGVSPTGKRLWSTDEVGGPTVQSYQSSDSRRSGVPVVGEDGQLYLFSEQGGMALHHMSIPDLVAAAPFTELLDAPEGAVRRGRSQSQGPPGGGGKRHEVRVVGEKRTSFFELDPSSGERLRVFTSQGGSLLDGRWEESRKRSSGGGAARRGVAPVTLARVDFRLRAFDSVSGAELWNVTYGEFRVQHNEGVAYLDGQLLDMKERGVPERFTIAGMPVAAVFGVSPPQSAAAPWSVVTAQSVAHSASRRAAGDALPDIFLQRIHLRNGGGVQVYATTAKAGLPLPCGEPGEAQAQAPPSASASALTSERALATAAASDEVCDVNRLETDFPLHGPHKVRLLTLARSGAYADTEDKLFLPLPTDGAEEQQQQQQQASRRDAPQAPRFQLDLFDPHTARVLAGSLLVVVVLLAIALVVLVRAYRRDAVGGAASAYPSPGSLRVCEYDPVSNSERVGDLVVSLQPEALLGRGCGGTTVLKGSLRGRPVAVKKVLSSQYKLAEKEIDLLIRSDEHPNIVRYFHTEVTRDFIFLALELCDSTLEQAVHQLHRVNSERAKTAKKSALRNARVPPGTIAFLADLASATLHLHQLRIVHCDIKPANILVVAKKSAAPASLHGSVASATAAAVVAGGARVGAAPEGAAAAPAPLPTTSTSLYAGAEHAASPPPSAASSAAAAAATTPPLTGLATTSAAAAAAVVAASAAPAREEGLLLGVGDLFEAKLSDMGLGRKFAGNTSSIAGGASMQGSGTVGWRAPELMLGLSSKEAQRGNADEHDLAARLGRKLDVFALGCVFCFVITSGGHPFGEQHDRERNILNGDAVGMERCLQVCPLAHDLVSKMIRQNPAERPSMEEVVGHPLLWSSERKLEFIKHVSDRLEADRVISSAAPGAGGASPRAKSAADSLLHDELERRAEAVIGKQGWLQRLHPTLRTDVVDSKKRYYTTHSLRDLLRYIRNKLSHFRELDDAVRELLSPMPEAFLDEFTGKLRFPHLVLHCYEIVLEACAHEPEFASLIGPYAVQKYSPSSLGWLERKIAEERAKTAAFFVNAKRPLSDMAKQPQQQPQQQQQQQREPPQHQQPERGQQLQQALNGSGDAEEPVPVPMPSSAPAPAPAPALLAMAPPDGLPAPAVIPPPGFEAVIPPPGFEAVARIAPPAPPPGFEPCFAESSPVRTAGPPPSFVVPPRGLGAHEQRDRDRTPSPPSRGAALSARDEPRAGASAANRASSWRTRDDASTMAPAQMNIMRGRELRKGEHLAALAASPPDAAFVSSAQRDANYKVKLCSHFKASGQCQFGTHCLFAHGEAELCSLAGPRRGASPWT